jgi:hypothetical protein
MLTRTQKENGGESYVQVFGLALIRVRDRLVFLYVFTPYRDKSDIQWAQDSLLKWKGDIINSNEP